jgi:uncharacterized protein with NRDE domain
MCVVSIFSEKNGDFILTQNRDESNLRPSSNEVENKEIYGVEYSGPVDLHSGGTWIYYSGKFAVCVLNGANKKHKHRPPYRKSRGLMILELLKFNSINEFIEEVNLAEIEPFTMIMLNRQNNEKKILVWDGTEKFSENHSDEKLIIRSSSTLYDETEKDNHRKAFENLKVKNPEQIFELHQQIKMLKNRKLHSVMTTSITQITQKQNQIHLKFCPMS